MKFDIETPLLTTGGIATAVYNFIQGDKLQIILGILVSLSVVVLNLAKLYITLKNKKK
tara:strand:+ start:2022 stop:2195 length:174 start_codon:yes stop_codon:yes gene_type:complete